MPLFFALVRHGETADNARGIFQGQTGGDLNAMGRAQAERLGERFRHAPPRAIIASDLARAAETAHIVSKACGVPVELDKGLREADVGAWSGKSAEEIARLYPEEWTAWRSGLDVRRGGGETYLELATRVGDVLDRIAGRLAATEVTETTGGRNSPVLVVSHGGAIKAWMARLLGVGGERLFALGAAVNGGVSVVERDHRGRDRLQSLNDIAHLEGLMTGTGID